MLRLVDQMSATLRGITRTTQDEMQKQKRSTLDVAGAWATIAAKLYIVQVAIRAVTGVFRGLARAALESEQATVRLNSALAAQGQYTKEGADALQEYITAMSNKVAIDDEDLALTAARIEAITGLSAKALPDAIKASVQLAAVTGQDLSAAAMTMSKAIGGSMVMLQRYGIHVKDTGDKIKNLEAVLKATAAGWDIAIARATTYEGKTALLSIAQENLKEAIGGVITQNPVFQKLITDLTTNIVHLTEWVDKNKESITKWVSAFLIGLTMIGQAQAVQIQAMISGFTILANGIMVIVRKVEAGAVNIAKIGVGAVIAILKGAESAINATIDIINSFLSGLKSILSGLGIAIPGMGGAALFGMASTIGQIDHIKIAISGIDTAYGQLDSTVKSLTLDLVDNQDAMIKSADAFKKMAGDMAGYTKSLLETAKLPLSESEIAGMKSGEFIAPGGGGAGKKMTKEAIDALSGAKNAAEAYANIILKIRGLQFESKVLTGPELARVLEELKNLVKALDRLTTVFPNEVEAATHAIGSAVSITTMQSFYGGKVGPTPTIPGMRQDDWDALMAAQWQASQEGKWFDIPKTSWRSMGVKRHKGMTPNLTFGSSFMGSIMEQITNPQFGASLGQAAMGGGQGLLSLLGGIGGGAISSAVAGIGSLGAFAGPLGALAGTLFTGLLEGFGKLFKKKDHAAENKPIKVEIVNLKDLALRLFESTIRSRIAAGATGVNNAMADVQRQAGRLGLAT